ncbi:MAG: FtsX-like permease family protein [Bacteroidales bacterium]|jgi:ABC-type lipoprotein release transport system permease subunit|nr:FtsX-like permease family protein [Bacteroidales bacterium]
MNTLFKIAWRNLWRNKKRSLITIVSIFMAVLLSVFMRSMQLGSYGNMTKAGISQVGYMQVQGKGYWENQSLNKAIVYSKELKEKINEVENVKSQLVQLQSFSLASAEDKTKGALIIGVVPEIENEQRGLAKKLVWGSYLSNDDKGVLIAQDLARYLGIIQVDKEIVYSADSLEQTTIEHITLLKDTLAIIGSGYQGITAAAIYPVKGILKFGTPQENGSLIYMTLENAQYTFSPFVPNLVTSVAIELFDKDEIEETRIEIQSIVGDKYDVMLWGEMLVELVQSIQSDNVGGIIMLGIIYMIVGFGLLGTVLMMTMERRREMAVMISVGLQRSRLAIILTVESIILAILGVIAGILISYPFIYYLFLNPIPLEGEMAEMMTSFNMEPIIPFSMDFSIFYNQALVIFILALLIALYPLFTAFRLQLIKAFNK